MFFKRMRVFFILSITIVLGGCAGGGGPGDGNGGSSSTSYVASDFETSEYNNQYGLASINASTAYADGYSGSDVTVAVIDSGVDTDHPDLDGNIASGGYDYVSDDTDPTPSGQGTYMSHGTHVAGIIAAEKNSTGMHGVAYNAKILALRVFTSAGVAYSADIRSAIDRAIDKSAKVINASFGSSTLLTSTANKWLSAHNNDIVSVHAAGNDGDDDPFFSAKLPAYSGYEALADTQIAVIAVDSDNDIASFSNKCGNSKNWCLAAPGVSIYSTYDTTDNNDTNDDGYHNADGTSMAAPHVAGAVAVLRSKWPSKTASQIVTILYDSATDLGDTGIDAVYGRGLLNLGSALTASGLLQIETSNGALYSISGDTLYLSSAFDSNFNHEFDIAVLDKYRRDFYIPFNFLVNSQVKNFETDFNHFIFKTEKNSSLNTYLGKLTFNNIRQIKKPDLYETRIKTENSLLNSNTTLAYNYSPELILMPFNNRKFKGSERPIYNNPFLSMINNAFTINATKTIYNNINISLGVLNGFLDEKNNHKIKGTSIGFSASPYSRLLLTSQYNILYEKDTFLATKFNGAMKTNSSRTDSLNLNAKLDFIADYSLIAQYTTGITKVNTAEDSLVYSVSDLNSDGYGITLLSNSIFSKNDEFTLSYNQPLRVNNGHLFLKIPAGLNLDDTMSFKQKRINLNPSGREINIQSSYSFDLTQNTELTGLIIYRSGQGHNNKADHVRETFIKIISTF